MRLTSDYRFRGISYSGRRPALQGAIELQEASGWFAGTWGSHSLGSRLGNEVDLYAGRSKQFGRVGYSLTAFAYMDGRVHGIQYAEVQALLWRSIGPLLLNLEASGVPKQRRNTPRNLYLAGTATLPLGNSPLSITLHGGWEDGFVRRKIDWEAGIAYNCPTITWSASLIGSTRAGERKSSARDAESTGFVLSAAAAF
jgi:uncharacterized protein (TIGR02001 family)